MHTNTILLQDIADNTLLPTAVYAGDSLKIIFANQSMTETWGRGKQVMGRKFIEVLPDSKKEYFSNQAMSVLKTGIPIQASDEKVEVNRNGVILSYYFNYSFIPLYDSDGNIYGVLNTAADVTELHESRQKNREADERLKMAIDASGIGTYEINLTTREVTACGNFKQILAVDELKDIDELISKIHPEDLAVRENAHREAEITGLISYEARIIRNQSEKWVKITGKIVHDPNGVPQTIIGTILDINEQKKFQEELKKQVAENTEELRRSNNDLLHFARIVSHDLKEPVRKIKFFNNLLKIETQDFLKEKSKRYFEKLDQTTQRMQNIIEGILAYSTINKSIQTVEKINLNAIIKNVKTDLELIIKEKGAILITGQLPDIEGAPILIHQLFYNLIQNALKFSKPDQPPRVTIKSSVIKDNDLDFLKIVITDNGIGLDPIYADRIFKDFERLHSKDEYEGNGLGLSLCRKIAKRHNGTISASGKKDNGAEFTVTLPLKQTKSAI
ncbi:PAS domain-containing sensor histidine kinase [Flavobacterium flavigenum]|uniref:PAS domain-containing sensor histidine kinase n=1 Tax=Flavobacterium flavigenum TaxID=3003258 RepID=UPI0022AC8EB7|nr:ATP-binding protein [Flavobacterium flavigenum]